MEGRKKGTKKEGKKGKEKRQKDTLKRVGSAYDDDCHEYYALSRRCFNEEIVLGVTMSSSFTSS